MNRTHRQIVLALVLLCGWGTTALAAEISDSMPAGTLLYVAWPGADAFGKASSDTAWGKLMAEPEIVQFGERWSKEIWPAIDRVIRENIGSGQEAEAYEPIRDLLAAA